MMPSNNRKTMILSLHALIFSSCATLSMTERAYPQGCATKDPSYYDYEQMEWPDSITLDVDDYEITRRLGNGKFSDVFEAIGPDEETYVVIKCLKPVSERKVRREVLVLQRCRHVANTVRLHGIVLRNNITERGRMPALVLQHAGRNAQWLCHIGKDDSLSDYEIRYYLCHLLVSLDGLHSVGVIHRDVKPRNVLINREPSATTPLMLIDLGLADFYLPNTKYNVRVASRHYKSPELLTGFEYYDYSIDLWGVGCILAGLLLRREPFFRGKDNFDQLGRIIALLGVQDLATFLHKYNLKVSEEIEQEILKHSQTLPRQSFWVHRAADAPVPPLDGMDLLQKLLVYDPDLRYTANQAIHHPYFDPVRDRVQKEVRHRRSNPRLTATSRHSSL